MITALLITAGALWLLKRTKSTNGIGVAKRRIYKEISLAQKAGVDFSKKYEDLTEDEILALERVSANTGYTETYFKGLKKAYDAISGIGSAYNVTDENGNTVLTWIEDPAYDEIERQQAMMEAREIDDERYWAMEHQAQEIEEKRKRALELEAKAAESRKRLKKMRQQPQQQSLFGIGYPKATPPFWYGIQSVEFIPHGEWSDPEIYYRGRLYNAVEAEDALYEVWREQLEYGDTEYDFETWMQKVGGEYLKADVLPYLSYESVN